MNRFWARTDVRPFLLASAGAALVLLIGVVDYLTGSEASIALFYLVPIATVTWFVGLRAGLFLSGLSAVVRLPEVWSTPIHLAHPLTSSWNAIVELGFFVVFTFVLSRLRSTTEREAKLARTDPLTGVLNRRAFTEAATFELARAERYGRPLSLVYLDVDDFKKVNDEGGHDAGDHLLAELADTLKRNLRSIDVVARYGGDEFVLLLPETGDEAADAVLGKIMGVLRSTVKNRWPVSISVGAVTVDGPSMSLDDLIRQADELVYAVKQGGKDCVRHLHLGDRDKSGQATSSSPSSMSKIHWLSSAASRASRR